MHARFKNWDDHTSKYRNWRKCVLFRPGKGTKKQRERSLRGVQQLPEGDSLLGTCDGKTLCPADWHWAEHSTEVGSGLGKLHFWAVSTPAESFLRRLGPSPPSSVEPRLGHSFWYNTVVKSTGSEVGIPGFKSFFCHSVTVSPWRSLLTCLGLSDPSVRWRCHSEHGASYY